MNNQSEYPKFISNHPCGKDMFLGKSQERVANSIAEHIQREEVKSDNNKSSKKNNYLPQIIGLEGGWGSGKSNLIQILKNNYLKDSYYFFEYDAWGHQEDLQRRSFLETLTNKLINDEILLDFTKEKLDNKEIKITWIEKLEDLLARKRRTKTKTNPKLSFAIIVSIILLIITPITTSIAGEDGINNWLKIILYLTPIIAIIVYISYMIFCKKNWADLFVVYSGEQIKDVVYETISEKEPTVIEFNKWMEDLSTGLSQKLIIVFDNMDRLPAYKVKELWSSIHTFFADSTYDNIWVIITFDKNHLANAFGNTESSKDEVEAKKLTSHFINKTFPVIYHVAAPIVSDLKLVFGNYLDEAFGKNKIPRKEKGTILRIFGIIKPNPTIRDVIALINELVSQKMAWKEEIPLLHIAIFSLTKDKIINDENSIAKNILSNDYYADINKLVGDEHELQESISALAYNIDKNNARQIPMTQYLKNLFIEENSTNDINAYSSNRYFIEVLLDVIRDIDISLIGRSIKKIDGLVTEELDDYDNRLEDIWDYLTFQSVKQKIDSLKFEEKYKILLNKGSEENKKSIFKYLCRSYQSFKELNGAEYYEAVSQLKDYITDKNLNLDIQTQLKETIVIPEVFINYVETAKDEYHIFKLICDNSKLNKYLVDQLPDDMKHTCFFDYLLGSSYDFAIFYVKLKDHIPTLTNSNFYWLNYAYKVVSPDKPLEVLLNQNQIATLQITITDKTIDGFFDISAMALGNNQGVTVDVNDDETIKEIAKRIEYYHSYGTLLTSCVSWNNPILNKLLVELTINPQEESKATISDILPHFEQILSMLNIESSILFKQLNGWHEYAEKSINKDNIEQTVTYTFYSHSILSKNDLTKHIHKVAKERLSEIDSDVLFQHRNQPTNYWLATAKTLIDGNVVRALTDNLVEFVKKIFIDISVTAALPNENLTTIIQKMPSSKITATIKDIGTDYYSGRKVINAQTFIFFEPYFREHKRIKDKEGDFVRTILNTVIPNNDCRALILQHFKFYADIVKISGDDAENFKTKIKQLCQTQPLEELNKFAGLIGASVEEEQSE